MDTSGGHPITKYVDKMGGGSKKSVFVHAQGIKTVHAERWGSKNDKIMSTYFLNAPLHF